MSGLGQRLFSIVEHLFLKLCWMFAVAPFWKRGAPPEAPGPEPVAAKKEASTWQMITFTVQKPDKLPKFERKVHVAVAMWKRQDGSKGVLRIDYPEYEELIHQGETPGDEM